MDPFADDADANAEEDADNWSSVPARTAAPRKRPWWRWNPVTLAAALFVTLWARELGGLPLGATGLLVLTIFAAWSLVPVALTGTPLWYPVPRPSESQRSVGSRRGARRAGAACRVTAVLIGATGVFQACMSVYWMLAQMGVYGGSLVQVNGLSRIGWLWSVFASGAYTAAMSFALAIGLWTIGGIAERVEELGATADVDRRGKR